jgi:hypothetical protein
MSDKTIKGRKALPAAEVVGPDFVGATPAEMAAQEAQARNALATVQANASALALQLGYEGALNIGTLEDGIRFYQRRSVEALLEVGKRLCLLQEITPRGEFDQRIEMLGFSRRSAYRFMQAAAKTAKSANLALLSTEVKSASAFLELVTHDDDVLQNIAEMDDIDRLSASELRERLRQSVQDEKFAQEKRSKAEERADKAEKKLAGKRPVVVPLDERITPFQTEITERQSLIEKSLAAHLEASAALEAWWTEEVTQQPDYDPTAAVPLPRSVGLVLMHMVDAAERAALLVGKLQHDLQERFGADIDEARQFLMQPGADDAAAA